MKANSENIFPVWQPQGYSTHIIAKHLAQVVNKKTSHTGTLDPMAEGVIIVLAGKDRLKKYELAKWKKEYEFEIVFGIKTDTYDGMGMITKSDFRQPNLENIKETINNFKGKYVQSAPLYSAKKVKGKTTAQLSREKKKFEVPKVSGEIYEIELFKIDEFSVYEMTKSLVKRINNVSGDFRQDKIIKQWKSFGEKHNETIMKLKIRVMTSKGLYIRSLSQDICNTLNGIGFVYELIRTKNGNYTKHNSKTLNEIFGENFTSKLDFDSKYKLN